MKQDDRPRTTACYRPTVARRPRQDRSEETRHRILDAVVELIAERGLAGVSHRAVAERAGVSLSATSYYFGSKAELERAALEEHYRRRLDDYRRTAELLAGADSSADELVDAAVELFTASDLTMLLSHFEVFLNSARRDDIRDLLAPTLDAMHDLLLVAIEPLGLPDPEAAATAITAVIEGVELRRVALGIDGRDELRGSLRALLRGLVRTDGEVGPERAAPSGE